MSAKKPNGLQAVLNRVAAAPAEDPAPSRIPSPAPAPVAAKPAGRPRQANREGLKLIAGHFPQETGTQLRILAAEEQTTIQALLEEAIEDLLVKKGRNRVGRGA